MIVTGPCDMYKQNVCTEKQWRKLLIYIAIFGRFHLSSMTTKQCLCIVVFRSQLWFISYVCKMYFIQVEAKYYQGYIYLPPDVNLLDNQCCLVCSMLLLFVH